MDKVALKKYFSLSILIILVIALFLRLYRIDEYLTFLGDEGRDVRIVRDLLHGDLVFIGPQTSIGNMYLGPLYYYLIAPALFIFNLNPVGPAVMAALLGVAAVWLTWFVGRRWFGSLVGLIAALLFALSPVAIIYSRSSWNPNPMPLFALLSVWSIYQVYIKQNWRFLIFTAVSFAFALQMHYLGLLLIPVLGLFWFLSFLKAKKSNQSRRVIIYSLISILCFLLLMSPLALFDLKHQGMNFQAFKTFFTNRQTTVNLNPANSNRFLDVTSLLTQELVLSRQAIYPVAISIVLFLSSIYLFFKNKNKKAFFILFSWLAFGVLGLSLYKQHVYAHYFGFLFPAIYLYLGLIFSVLWQSKIIGRPVAIFSLSLLIYLSIIYSPLKQTPNRQLYRTQEIVNLIIKQSNNKPFNFGLIAKQNYDESYRYFFENLKAPLVRGENGITDQLFVVCEDASPAEASGEGRGDKCQPLGDPAWQVAIFGPAKIDNQWQVDYIKVYKLVHST